MSNSKAQKTQLQFPPLYNFAKDTPHVDSTFRNVEEINAPLLNDMIMPVYNKATGKKAVYDKAGNRYYYDASTHNLVKEALDGTTTNLHRYYDNNLEKNNITDQMQDVVSLDINGNNQTIVTVKERGLAPYINIIGKVSSHEFNVHLTLLEDSRVVEVRTRYLDADNVFTVIYFDYQGTEKIYIYRNEAPIVVNQYVTWYKQFPTEDGTISMPTTIPIGGVAPCIHISKPAVDYYVVSLTAKAGSVNDLIDGSVFASYIIANNNNNVMVVGRDIKPANASSASGTEMNTTELMISSSTSIGQSVIKVISNNNTDWYYYNSNATNLTQCQKISFIPNNFDLPGKYIVGSQILAPNNSSTSSSSSSTTTKTTETGSTSTSSSSSSTTTVAGSTTYSIYQFTVYTKTFNINFKGDGNVKYQIPFTADQNSIRVYNLAAGNSLPQAGTNTSVRLDGGGSGYTKIRVLNTNINATSGRTSISFTYRYLSGQEEPYIVPEGQWRIDGYNPTTLNTLFNATYNIANYLNTQDPLVYSYARSVGVYTYSVYPNIWLDDGRSFALFSFDPNKWSNDNSTAYWDSTEGNFKIKGGMILTGAGLSRAGDTYSVTTTSSVNPTSTPFIRSGSVSINQNFFDLTLKLNNAAATDPLHLAQGVSETGGSRFLEVNVNSASGVRYSPGTSRFSSFNYYSYAQYGDPTIQGTGEDLMIFTVGGSRASLGNALDSRSAPKWNLLYNVTTAGTSFVQGISISENASRIGTLLTPWQSIQESAYITFAPGKVIYKDKNNDWWEIKITNDTPELFTILDDRYIVVNTYEYLNAYDSFTGKMVHYATDYNGRLKHGQNAYQTWRGALATAAKEMKPFPYMRTTANGINPLYYVMPRNPLCAPIYPLVSRYRVKVGSEIAPASATVAGAEEIDIFWSRLAQNACKYRYSIKEISQLATFINHNLQDLYYPGSSSASASLTPNIFTKYLDGAGNNDMVIEDFDAYVMTYYDSQAYLLYSAATQTTNQFGRDDVFFVIQGQFYGVIGDKLYALYYSNGAISNRDAIIDLGSIKFIGSNPMIAFWWDPVNRTIRSFTGDNNLDQLYSASKFTNIDGKGWYDKTTQSIFVNTNIGLLVFGPRNTYLLDKFQNVTNVQFSEDGVTHITSNGETYDMVYYKRDGYEIIPVDIETSFYGLGANEYTNIDRWDITLFDPTGEKKSSTIKVGVRSLTDVTVKSEEKELKINPSDYDDFSDSVLIRYVPKLQKGQGIRLYLETPLTVQKIIPHIADEGHGTLTANRKGL